MKFIERRYPTNAEIDRSQKLRVVTIFCNGFCDERYIKLLIENLRQNAATIPAISV